MPVFEIDWVYILDPDTGAIVAGCEGPTATGACPRQVGAAVPCGDTPL